MLREIENQAKIVTEELIKVSRLEKNDIFVVGCSTSEVAGEKIGTYSDLEVAKAIFNGIYPVLEKNGVFLAAQCCEHLNRAIIISKDALKYYNFERVNVMPQKKAGGAFATTCYQNIKDAVAIESVKANCGIDIGGTLIGMHLKSVAVPVRLSINKIGMANIICARTRPKFVGGERAIYNEDLF